MRGYMAMLLSFPVLAGVLGFYMAPSYAQQIAAGVTCADVRKLTSFERWYWRKRLALTDEQVRAIRKQCALK